MGYVVNGTELDTDDQGYLLEPDYSDEAVRVIAAAEGITLGDDHWKVVQYLRDEYREHGHTPNFRNMLKGMADGEGRVAAVAIEPVDHVDADEAEALGRRRSRAPPRRCSRARAGSPDRRCRVRCR